MLRILSYDHGDLLTFPPESPCIMAITDNSEGNLKGFPSFHIKITADAKK